MQWRVFYFRQEHEYGKLRYKRTYLNVVVEGEDAIQARRNLMDLGPEETGYTLHLEPDANA